MKHHSCKGDGSQLTGISGGDTYTKAEIGNAKTIHCNSRLVILSVLTQIVDSPLTTEDIAANTADIEDVSDSRCCR